MNGNFIEVNESPGSGDLYAMSTSCIYQVMPAGFTVHRGMVVKAVKAGAEEWKKIALLLKAGDVVLFNEDGSIRIEGCDDDK